MQKSPSMLFLGATGRIGSALIRGIESALPNIRITALVRSAGGVGTLSDLGINIVHGNLDNLAQIVDLVSVADIVVNAARSDCVALSQAINIGLMNRRTSARKPVLLHISQAALNVRAQEAQSLHLQTAAYDDMDLARWVADSSLVDNEILQQSTNSSFLAFIVAPTWILGGTRRQITGRTHAISRVIRYALVHRQVQIANGMTAGNAVLLEDVVKTCIQILRLVFSRNFREPIDNAQLFFVPGSDFYWHEAGAIVARKLYRRHLVESETVYHVSDRHSPELADLCRTADVVSRRSALWGLEPPRAFSVLEQIERDVEDILSGWESASG
ncbi:SubName: Full=Uncharacterized protein {ECO:0000313/EMBL:CCA71585.1} [Serendipita indica DSM 11827]|nr:SubName: Full=Uncharacterized protein {ECO:0000313/EMBL:CCA71585.1} [Serendipita indica DSM 11827]